ncbi:hypothetical protein F2Q69_00028284 [Brassica cretica]|uniref:Uncharacterized protein n=1 Tax=Brassica cretica TaxID=69181 RepID=A0A8S9RSL7_BRACR|nr:hypothetical protein F2Q69_00028284 [Brassica cretica]
MNSTKQIEAERPRHVAPTSRFGLRERPQWVALRGRSGSIVLSSRDRNASDLGVSLWPSRSGLREQPGVVALIGRSGSVFVFHRDEMASNFSGSLQRGRSERSPLLCSKCTQMSPRTPCGTPIPDKDSYLLLANTSYNNGDLSSPSERFEVCNGSHCFVFNSISHRPSSTILKVLSGELKAGRRRKTVVTHVLRSWEARNVKKGGDLMGVYLVLLDEKDTYAEKAHERPLPEFLDELMGRTFR